MISGKSFALVFAVLLAFVAASYGEITHIVSPTPYQVVLTCTTLKVEYTATAITPVTFIFGTSTVISGIIPRVGTSNAVIVPLPACLKPGNYPLTLSQDNVVFPPVTIQVVDGCRRCESSSSC